MMMRSTLLAVCLALTVNGQSQVSEPDSVLRLLKQPLADTHRVNLLVELGDYYIIGTGDMEQGIHFANQALSLSEKIGFSKGKAAALSSLGIISFFDGDYSKSVKLFNSALAIRLKANDLAGVASSFVHLGNVHKAQGNFPEALKSFSKSLETTVRLGDKKGQAAALNNIALVYESQGNYPEALKHHYASLRLKEELNDQRGVARSNYSIGTVYRRQKNYPEALARFTECLALFEKINDRRGLTSCYNSLGNLYYDQANEEKVLEKKFTLYNEALISYGKSLAIAEELGDPVASSNIYNGIGCVYAEKAKVHGNPDSAAAMRELALKCNFASLGIYEEIGNRREVSSVLSNIADVYVASGKALRAKPLYEKALRIARELRDHENISNCYFGLSEVCGALGEYKRGLEYFKLYVACRDSIINEENTRQMVEERMQYEFEKKEAISRANQEKKDALAREELAKQTMQRNGFIGGFALMLGLAGVVYRSYLGKRKANAVISQQKREVEAQKHLVEEKQKEILDSISYARRIQEAILPSKDALTRHLKDGFVLFCPKDVVSGDFYWMEKAGNRIFFAVADCTGHGVPGALVSVVCSHALSKAVLEEHIHDPGKILDRSRELIIERFAKSGESMKDGMDISLVCFEDMEAAGRHCVTMKWAGANNPLWIISAESGGATLTEVKADKQPVGMHTDPKPFTTKQFALRKGDTVYLFTDGFADQFGGEAGKKFKAANFKKLLLSVQHESMDRQQELIAGTFFTWKGPLEQVDDICVIGVRI